MAQKPKIQPGDKLTLEVEVMDTWEDGAKVTFSLYGYASNVTIPADSPNILLVTPGGKRPKARSRRES